MKKDEKGKMKNKTILITIISITILTVFLLTSCGAQDPSSSPAAAGEKVAKTVYSQVQQPAIGSIGGDWSVIGLQKSGMDIEAQYYEDYYHRVCDYVTQVKGELSSYKSTEYSRVCIALSMIGKDPTDVAGYDLLKPLEDLEFVSEQGINGPIFALIAANVCDYQPILDKEEQYIEYILKQETKTGGFSMEGPKTDPYIDITAMAVQALSYYKDDAHVKEVIDRAVETMAGLQEKSGGYGTSESDGQTIIALTSLGIDPTADERFIKNEKNLVEDFMEYMDEDGMFSHEKEDDADLFATEQALCAIDALVLYGEGNLLYEK